MSFLKSDPDRNPQFIRPWTHGPHIGIKFVAEMEEEEIAALELELGRRVVDREPGAHRLTHRARMQLARKLGREKLRRMQRQRAAEAGGLERRPLAAAA
jgi:hypothetical protein